MPLRSVALTARGQACASSHSFTSRRRRSNSVRCPSLGSIRASTPGNAGCEPATVRDRHEAVVVAVEQQHGPVDRADVEAPRLRRTRGRRRASRRCPARGRAGLRRAGTPRTHRSGPRGRPARAASPSPARALPAVPPGCPRASVSRYGRSAASPSSVLPNSTWFSSPIPASQSRPSASTRRHRGEARDGDESLVAESGAGEHVRAAAGDAPAREPVEPEGVGDRRRRRPRSRRSGDPACRVESPYPDGRSRAAGFPVRARARRGPRRGSPTAGVPWCIRIGKPAGSPPSWRQSVRPSGVSSVCTAGSLRPSLLCVAMSTRSIRVVRVSLLVAIVAWFFSPPDWRYAVPLWLPFVVALALEVEFAVGGVVQLGRQLPRERGRGPQRADLERFGWEGEPPDDEDPEFWTSPPVPRPRELVAAPRSPSRSPCSASSALVAWGISLRRGWNSLDHSTQVRVEHVLSQQASRIAGHHATVTCDTAGPSRRRGAGGRRTGRGRGPKRLADAGDLLPAVPSDRSRTTRTCSARPAARSPCSPTSRGTCTVSPTRASPTVTASSPG